jgi:hypothetical protein
MNKRISGNRRNRTETIGRGLVQLCKREVTGSIPVRAILALLGSGVELGSIVRMVAILALAAAPFSFAPPAGAQTPERPGLLRGAEKRLPEVTPVRADALTRALRQGEIGVPRYALERATSLFHLGAVRARYGGVQRPDPRSATLILRDLTLRLNALAAADKVRARRLLARPTDMASDPDGNGYTVAEATPLCTTEFCIHYVPSTVDAPPPSDVSPADGIPDWVVKVRATVLSVWAWEAGALGYREPLSDATSPNNGGDGRLDVYLANLGDDRLYGYCTTDDPKINDPSPTTFDVSAYCVIDNDFLEPIFSEHTPLQNTRFTVAHEFFHAVQFAYDAGEDLWLMEGTATWIEDEVYDAINDNRRYLARSPLTASFVPLDLGTQGFQYGSWIYFRRLSERFGPRIVRSIWKRADASAPGPDDYSVQAVSRALNRVGTSFRVAFNDFSRANRRARLVYEEGAAYPARPAALRTWTLTRARRARSSAALYQLGAETVVFKPGRGIGRRAKLEIKLNLPPASRGSEAAVLSFRRSGTLIKNTRIGLNSAGDKTLRVGFGRRAVGRVELVLINASRRYDCWLGLPGTCQGLPLDDLLTYRYSGRAIG